MNIEKAAKTLNLPMQLPSRNDAKKEGGKELDALLRSIRSEGKTRMASTQLPEDVIVAIESGPGGITIN